MSNNSLKNKNKSLRFSSFQRLLLSMRIAVVLLTTAALLLLLSVEIVAGDTFSSRLIHGYSDEAVSFWASKGKSITWPKRESVQHVSLLLNNDLKRQRLKLGSHKQLLFPSEGSETHFYGNDLSWMHYAWIDIGTPSASFLVALDAGSDLLWLLCDCVQCAPLFSSYYSMLGLDNITDSEDTPQLLAWWRVRESQFPKLSRMVKDLLAIQATLVASESAFSAGRFQIGDHRYSLAEDSLGGVAGQDISKSVKVPSTPSPSGLTSNPLPTTEQQRSPGGHAVAPAIASKATPKPSAASPHAVSWHYTMSCLLLSLVVWLPCLI